MRGKRAKSIRRYVGKSFPFLSQDEVRGYTQRADGVIMAKLATFRSLYKIIKRNYYRKRRGQELIGIPTSFGNAVTLTHGVTS